MTTAVLETGVTTARRSWSGLLAPFGGLGLVAGLITIFLSPAGDETGDTPAEVVAWATTHRTWNVALLLFAVASIGLGGMFVAGLHARLRAVATDTESALVLIGGTAFTLCFAFCWISWLGPLDGIAADEQLALAQASAYLAYDDVGWFFLGSAGVGAALMAVPASLAAMRAGCRPGSAGSASSRGSCRPRRSSSSASSAGWRGSPSRRSCCSSPGARAPRGGSGGGCRPSRR